MTTDEKVCKLREILKKEGLFAYVFSTGDPHFSEYPADCYKSVQFLTGFTGSNATVFVSLYEAVIWTDSRYFIQCAEEIKGTVFVMKKTDGPERTDFKEYVREACKGRKIALPAENLSIRKYADYERAGLDIVPTDDFVSGIWTERPAAPLSPIREVPLKIAGEDRDRKIEKLRAYMETRNLDYLLLTSLDDIAWLLNLRGGDVRYTPVFYSYLLAGRKSVVLFTEKRRATVCGTGKVRSECSKKRTFGFEVKDYEEFFPFLNDIQGKIGADFSKTNVNIKENVKNGILVDVRDYVEELKARKNKTEQSGMRKAHKKDGASLVKLLRFLHSYRAERKKILTENGKSGQNETRSQGILSEIAVAKMLEEFKKADSDYLEPSFETISAFKEHGAIVHYSADEESNMEIDGNGLLVLDCGSQYAYGTTDITRTLLFGTAQAEQKRDYTAVLKGHLALERAIFPEGTKGYQLDALAKAPVWSIGASYFHGTGHGVGHNLSVHEGPESISPRANDVKLEEGMILSVEPGLYREGRWGIRIENLVLVKRAFTNETGVFLKFEPLTLCPYEQRLIDKKMLTSEEIAQINHYHKRVYNELKSGLTKNDALFLEKMTREI